MRRDVEITRRNKILRFRFFNGAYRMNHLAFTTLDDLYRWAESRGFSVHANT